MVCFMPEATSGELIEILLYFRYVVRLVKQTVPFGVSNYLIQAVVHSTCAEGIVNSAVLYIQ